MRVVHISTYDVDGGAARAAFRLHESLLAAGHDSTMLVRTRHSGAESVQQSRRAEDASALLGKLIQEHYIDQNRSALSTTYFSSNWPGTDVSKHELVERADIIHLHWISAFLSLPCLTSLQSLGKPVVWTLHDQRAYTGGCHYTSGCNRFEKDCSGCPQLVADRCGLTAANLSDQQQSFGAGYITVLAPSQWMAQCARRSAIFARSRIEVIPYGIDIERFRAVPQEEARTRLVLPQNHLLLLFGVDNAKEKRKGLAELFTALQACGNDENFKLAAAEQRASVLSFGDLDATPTLPIPIRSFGRLRSDELLSSLYSASDLFLHPSLEDNLPNTVLESMCCGTPVGAFSSGGVPDMVVDGQTGFLAPTGDLDGLRRIILRGARDLQQLRSMRPACRRHVENKFTYAHHAQACLSLYDDLLRKTPRPRQRSIAVGVSLSGDAGGARFQQIFAPVLKQVFDKDPLIHLHPANSFPSELEKSRSARFKRRTKKLLKRAIHKSWDYTRLKTALEVEFSILNDKERWSDRAKRLLKRLLPT